MYSRKLQNFKKISRNLVIASGKHLCTPLPPPETTDSAFVPDLSSCFLITRPQLSPLHSLSLSRILYLTGQTGGERNQLGENVETGKSLLGSAPFDCCLFR